MHRPATFALALLLTVPLFAREGFGFMKKAVEIDRTIPPSTSAGARRVAVKVKADRSDVKDDATTLERYLTDAILGGGGTLADGKGELDVLVTLVRLESHESRDTETEYVRQQTGTKRKWNEKKKKYEDEAIYSNVPVQKEYTVLTASLTGTYEIFRRTEDVASGDLEESFRDKYGDNESAPAPSEIEDRLMKAAATRIAAHLVPTQDRVSILLPRASFENLIGFAESGAWDRYLAAVEGMNPLRSASDEAYRQYALAIAKEALAYQTDDRKEALDLLRSAVSHYEAAIAGNGREEFFRKGYTSLMSSNVIGVPLERAMGSVARFEAWVNAHPAPRSTRVEEPEPSGEMNNQMVVELSKAGLSDENIILAIDAADHVEFDVSPSALITLSKSGVSRGVIAHMQKKGKRK